MNQFGMRIFHTMRVDDFYKKVEEMKLGEYVDDYGIMVYSFRNGIDDDEARIIFEKWLKRTGLFKDKTKEAYYLIR